MNACKCHYLWEGKQRGILLTIFLHLHIFLKGAFCKESPILMERNGQFKSSQFVDLNWASVVDTLPNFER